MPSRVEKNKFFSLHCPPTQLLLTLFGQLSKDNLRLINCISKNLFDVRKEHREAHAIQLKHAVIIKNSLRLNAIKVLCKQSMV
jgi:hypothetical protein